MSVVDMIPDTNIPKPYLDLSEVDGNAFALIGAVQKKLRRAGVPKAVIEAFKSKAMSGDYDNVVATCMEYTTDED